MKTFIQPIPANNNVKGSGVGSPPGDVNKISNALVEIRSSVPNSPSDINAATAAQLTALLTRVVAVTNRVEALKTKTISDAFTRTTIGSSYTVIQGTPVITNNQLTLTGGPMAVYTLMPTKTSQMYAKIYIAALPASGTTHPGVLCNYSVDSLGSSNYRAQYNASVGRWEIYRRVSGTSTLVASLIESAPTTAYNLKISQFDGLVTLAVNDAIKLTYADSAPLRGKMASLALTWNTAADEVQRVDDFIYGDI